MNSLKLHSPWPYFLLTAVLGLVPVLNNMYPPQFYPALSPAIVETAAVIAGTFAAFMGFSRGWALLEHFSKAKAMLREAVSKRSSVEGPDSEGASNAGRMISRIIRNSDEDLREIDPDFSLASLRRLASYSPELLMEIEKGEDAQIRLGVVGAYLGETACRKFGWQWRFLSDPSLGRFSYLVSVVQKGDRELDPFLLAGDLLMGRKSVVKQIR